MHIAAEHSYRDIGLITLYDGDVKGLSGTRGSLSWKPWRAFTNVSTNGGIGTGTKMEHVTGPSVHNCHEYMHIIFFYHVAALHFPIALVESQCLEVRRKQNQRFPSDRQYKSFLGIAQSEIQVNENSFSFFLSLPIWVQSLPCSVCQVILKHLRGPYLIWRSSGNTTRPRGER